MESPNSNYPAEALAAVEVGMKCKLFKTTPQCYASCTTINHSLSMHEPKEPELPFWMEQCLAARYYLRPKLGPKIALDYLIREKFVNFIESLDRHHDRRADLPAFIAEIRRGFRLSQIRAFLDEELKGRGGPRERRAHLKIARELLLSPRHD